MSPSHSDKPLVSVIVPTYKRADLLRRSIQSVLDQTYEHLELIVVDDCSPDHTAQVIGGFNDPRLRYIRLQQNRRAAHARNVGIAAAQGELIAFQDDDDIWLLEKLQRQVSALLTAPATVGLNLAGYVRHFADRSEYIGGAAAIARLDFRRGPLGGFGLIATPGWLVRRACLEAVGGFDERMRSFDDWELALRLRKVCEFGHVDEPLYIQNRAGGGAMWNNLGVYASDMRIVLQKHGADWAAEPAVLARHCRFVGRYEAEFGAGVEARSWLRQSIRHDPLSLASWALYCLSLLGAGTLGRMLRLRRRLRAALRAPPFERLAAGLPSPRAP